MIVSVIMTVSVYMFICVIVIAGGSVCPRKKRGDGQCLHLRHCGHAAFLLLIITTFEFNNLTNGPTSPFVIPLDPSHVPYFFILMSYLLAFFRKNKMAAIVIRPIVAIMVNV